MNRYRPTVSLSLSPEVIAALHAKKDEGYNLSRYADDLFRKGLGLDTKPKTERNRDEGTHLDQKAS